MILNYDELPLYLGKRYGDHWYIDDCEDTIRGFTSMDNGYMEEFLADLCVKAKHITWERIG